MGAIHEIAFLVRFAFNASEMLEGHATALRSYLQEFGAEPSVKESRQIICASGSGRKQPVGNVGERDRDVVMSNWQEIPSMRQGPANSRLNKVLRVGKKRRLIIT
jgi:hypothetical protein